MEFPLLAGRILYPARVDIQDDTPVLHHDVASRIREVKSILHWIFPDRNPELFLLIRTVQHSRQNERPELDSS